MEKERLSWDGRKTADFSKISNDGLYEWDGFEWKPRKRNLKQNPTSQNGQKEELEQENRELTKVTENKEQIVTYEAEIKVGAISPEGYHQWDGKKWIPVELATVSEDGYWIWNGTKWVPNRTQKRRNLDKTNSEQIKKSQVANYPIFAQNTSTIFVPQQKKNNNMLVNLASIIVISVAIFFIASIIIVSSVLYFWASGLAEEQEQVSVIGTWYNIEDTMTLYPNGTGVDSTDTLSRWSTEKSNLTTTFFIDEEEIDVVWKYEIRIDSDDDQVLFMAYYESENGTLSNEIAENSCIVYIDSVNGINEDYYDGKLAVIPDWCEF